MPITERVKFLAISASKLDEPFMIRVAGLKQQIAGGVVDAPADGFTPAEQLLGISERSQKMVADQYTLYREVLRPGLAQIGVQLLAPLVRLPLDRAGRAGVMGAAARAGRARRGGGRS